MNASMNSTLAATLIATGVGVGIWITGLAKAMWPAHPQILALLITIVVGIVVTQTWPAVAGRK